ncbi:hypothetical protein FHS29_003846 [Saccharothrix tamanrassetensis]|uniref:Uncharacterized protein n=1 Tax=Saccharothrix tamanrassetensis TaxID=1051531 RepID=A0A841CJV8_9PSEU|nr:DUF6357 family protein [Saccharothrix tamanrassetensis]MBB5957253.1 hypothetical protein [Saccharothrix tamanrassetensis]
MRPLTFSDDKGNQQEWLPGGPRSAVDAFLEFVDRHRDVDNASFGIEDGENEEALVLLFDSGAIRRTKGAQNPRTEYRLVKNGGDYRTQAANFIRGGFTALDRPGPWLPDVAGLGRARLRSEFDGSVLRRTHPRELRRRLAVLTFVDGREPVPVGGVTHFGFGDGRGDTVNAWFAADGRGLVVTFDRSSALDCSGDARAQAGLYEGVAADLVEWVRDVPETDTTFTVAHPDGGTLVAATGVFTFSGPCALAEGLVSRLQETGLGVEATGVGRLLEGFLTVGDFTPDAVAAAVDWWSAEDIAKGFAAAAALEPERSGGAPLEREAVDRFCQIWADSGYNDRWDVHYVLFDGDTVEEAGEDRDELLGLVRTLGLERVDAPPGAATGEVWVRTDPRIDAELGHWS